MTPATTKQVLPLLPSSRSAVLLAVLEASATDVQELQARHDRALQQPLSDGAVYTTLARLEQVGWIRKSKGIDGDGRKVYFNITRSGRRALDCYRTHLARLVRCIGTERQES